MSEELTLIYSLSIYQEIQYLHPLIFLYLPVNSNPSTFPTTKYPTIFSNPSLKHPIFQHCNTSISTEYDLMVQFIPFNNFWNIHSAWPHFQLSNVISAPIATWILLMVWREAIISSLLIWAETELVTSKLHRHFPPCCKEDH